MKEKKRTFLGGGCMVYKSPEGSERRKFSRQVAHICTAERKNSALAENNGRNQAGEP